jgi:hypothetical protein
MACRSLALDPLMILPCSRVQRTEATVTPIAQWQVARLAIAVIGSAGVKRVGDAGGGHRERIG